VERALLIKIERENPAWVDLIRSERGTGYVDRRDCKRSGRGQTGDDSQDGNDECRANNE
jgi:hypothetical protein